VLLVRISRLVAQLGKALHRAPSRVRARDAQRAAEVCLDELEFGLVERRLAQFFGNRRAASAASSARQAAEKRNASAL
jgi:hypothetical protein